MISIARFDDAGYTVTFANRRCRVSSRSGRVVADLPKSRGLYRANEMQPHANGEVACCKRRADAKILNRSVPGARRIGCAKDTRWRPHSNAVITRPEGSLRHTEDLSGSADLIEAIGESEKSRSDEARCYQTEGSNLQTSHFLLTNGHRNVLVVSRSRAVAAARTLKEGQ